MSLIPKRTLNQKLQYQAMAIKSRNSRLKYVKLTHSDIKKKSFSCSVYLREKLPFSILSFHICANSIEIIRFTKLRGYKLELYFTKDTGVPT